MLLYGPTYPLVPIKVGAAELFVDVNDSVSAAESVGEVVFPPDLLPSVYEAVSVSEENIDGPMWDVAVGDLVAFSYEDVTIQIGPFNPLSLFMGNRIGGKSPF